MLDESPFERVVRAQRRPGYVVAPVAITWDAVVFDLRGARDAVVCVPRVALAGFFDDLDAGRLDERLQAFLSSPPSGRVLRSADQTREPGLFDELASPDAIVPPERRPGRPTAFGRGGGTPQGERRNKRSRRPRPRRALVGAAVATVVVVAGVVAAVALTGGNSKTTVAANASSTTTTTLASVTVPASTVAAGCKQFAVAGTWNVTQGNGFYKLVLTFQQTGTQLTGTALLPEGQWETAGWSNQTNPFTGTLTGDQLKILIDAPHSDGTPSHGDYRGTVTDAGIVNGTATDLDAPARGSFPWSATGGQATCTSH